MFRASTAGKQCSGVIIEAQDDLAGLAVDSEQELVFLLTVGERNDGIGGDIGGIKAEVTPPSVSANWNGTVE